MLKRLMLISIFAGILFYQGCRTSISDNSNINSNNNQTVTQTVCPEPQDNSRFPSYAPDYAPPVWYCRELNNPAKRLNLPVFRLSQDYSTIPASFPEVCDAADCPWLKFDFKTHPYDYMKAVLEYAYKGNLENDWSDPKGWFSAPYMHLDTVNQFKGVDPVGREFMHGMTMERVTCLAEINDNSNKVPCPAYPSDLTKLNEGQFYNFAVSFYNERGASYINNVWKEVLKKEPDKPDFEVFKKGFAEGTVAVKFLFTQASPEAARPLGGNLDYLKGGVEWNADISRARKTGKTEECLKTEAEFEKCFPKMRLLQIDIAVKDNRSKDQTGWVFATFMYHNEANELFNYEFKNLPAAEIEKRRAWLRVEPVGLMFGNDPEAKFGEDRIKESINNSFVRVPQHFGCDGRLSGPVDNPVSSCLACHALSETPKDLNPNSVRYADMSCKNQDNIDYWFRNINPRLNKTFTMTGEIFTLDYSLQMREGIFRYWLQENNCFAETGKCFPDLNAPTSKENLQILPDDKIKSIMNRQEMISVKPN